MIFQVSLDSTPPSAKAWTTDVAELDTVGDGDALPPTERVLADVGVPSETVSARKCCTFGYGYYR